MSKLTIILAVAGVMASVAPSLPADLAMAPVPPIAVEIPPAWQFQATLYGWATSLSGDVGVGRLPSASVDVGFDDILKHLDGGLMGAFFARSEDYIVGVDIVAAKLSSSVNLKVGSGPLAQFRSGSLVDFEQTMFIGTAFGGIRVPIGGPDLHLYATAGARYQYLKAKLTLTRLATGFDRTTEQGQDWVDPVVGFVAKYDINDKWFVSALADIGGFGVSSDLTTQGVVAVGYNWTRSVSTTLGYRALYTDYENDNGSGGSFRYKTTMYGPFAGLNLQF
ncbi:MAG: hypothetical protein ACRED3_15270 [Bradyrhizobium sp.]